eukprot:jgi/Botrbrau1/20472/Bobra.145_2s0033.1
MRLGNPMLVSNFQPDHPGPIKVLERPLPRVCQVKQSKENRQQERSLLPKLPAFLTVVPQILHLKYIPLLKYISLSQLTVISVTCMLAFSKRLSGVYYPSRGNGVSKGLPTNIHDVYGHVGHPPVLHFHGTIKDDCGLRGGEVSRLPDYRSSGLGVGDLLNC